MATVSKQPPVTGSPQKKRPYHRRILVSVILLSVLAILILIVASASGGGGGPYRARVIGHSMLNPALVAVQVQVTNTGKTAGTPEITITVSGPGGANPSSDVVTPHSPIRAGQTVTVNDAITVTGPGGAQYTQVSASAG